MVISHPEGISSDAGAVVTDEVTEAVDPRGALCLNRAFGVVALGTEAPKGELSDALVTIQSAQETWTATARARATIYRCKAEACSHAILSFTTVGAPTVPDPSNLYLEPLPGTQDCVLPPEMPTPTPET